MYCFAFLFHILDQLLAELVDDSKQQQNVKNSDVDWNIANKRYLPVKLTGTYPKSISSTLEFFHKIIQFKSAKISMN